MNKNNTVCFSDIKKEDTLTITYNKFINKELLIFGDNDIKENNCDLRFRLYLLKINYNNFKYNDIFNYYDFYEYLLQIYKNLNLPSIQEYENEENFNAAYKNENPETEYQNLIYIFNNFNKITTNHLEEINVNNINKYSKYYNKINSSLSKDNTLNIELLRDLFLINYIDEDDIINRILKIFNYYFNDNEIKQFIKDGNCRYSIKKLIKYGEINNDRLNIISLGNKSRKAYDIDNIFNIKDQLGKNNTLLTLSDITSFLKKKYRDIYDKIYDKDKKEFIDEGNNYENWLKIRGFPQDILSKDLKGKLSGGRRKIKRTNTKARKKVNRKSSKRKASKKVSRKKQSKKKVSRKKRSKKKMSKKKSISRKLKEGPRGGKFYISKGKKIYV